MANVLFVCVENACRSQMAQGFFNALATEGMAESAGTRPAARVNPQAIQVMREEGIDIGGQKPKVLTPALVARSDVIVTMGCLEGCPLAPREKTMEWGIEDPAGQPVEKFREVRDDIRRRVEQMILQTGGV